ncbi:MAG: hypothetical protein JAY75_23010 [Candidatus Thiodiazotropha taylori]|nr:hypothetical protein [Candidatus Thiodiazotropha taylori]MCW4226994.1 hypothetical protein [Candidatus Thiodiazotropha endolucinida]MCG7882933.1 hypothetical protein [Candidatus Thiodiazotropha taylori]MCG7888553.1 hypothetical protein [Candidatus Thiodiazotropha taylori]MCG7892253.1 hypothetical protein [Candidatus Thiodiazotropha taylori]
MSTANNCPKFHAFRVTDKDGKPGFIKVGAAWENQSGGLNIRLEGESQGDIYLFPPKERNTRATTGRKTTAAGSK